MREEAHEPEKYGAVPAEDSFWDGWEAPVVDRVRSVYISTERSVWDTGDNDPKLAVTEWSARQQAARSVHGGVGTDPFTAGPGYIGSWFCIDFYVIF